MLSHLQEAVKYARGEKPTLANKTGEWRFVTPAAGKGISPCRQACLLEGEIPGWLDAVKKERWEEAYRIMEKNNPFPAITGYVCFHPCMESCNRSFLDEGINIKEVERAVGLKRHQDYRHKKRSKANQGSTAVVGSGPAGLSCAYYLNREGFKVTVFERASTAGGLLALGIPEYRLPRAVLRRELEILAAEGITFKLKSSLGSSFDLNDLYAEFDQVFLATGSSRPRPLTIPGAHLPGIWSALQYLSLINTGNEVSLGQVTAIIGGGNAAIDAARTALRQSGVEKVVVVYRRSKAEMPAHAEDLAWAEKEGIEFIFNAVPRVLEGAEGRLKRALLDQTQVQEGKVKIVNTEPSYLNCDSLIYALGQEIDYSVLGSVSRPNTLYAGGDFTNGPATVPEAIKAGRLAAASIAARLRGAKVVEDGLKGKAVSFADLHLAYVNRAKLLPSSSPTDEAARCLGCGSCNSCGTCNLFCPDGAVQEMEGQFVIDMDYCKGCGICARECPARALVMEGGAGYAC